MSLEAMNIERTKLTILGIGFCLFSPRPVVAEGWVVPIGQGDEIPLLWGLGTPPVVSYLCLLFGALFIYLRIRRSKKLSLSFLFAVLAPAFLGFLILFFAFPSYSSYDLGINRKDGFDPYYHFHRSFRRAALLCRISLGRPVAAPGGLYPRVDCQ